jgi:hypothetical protein
MCLSWKSSHAEEAEEAEARGGLARNLLHSDPSGVGDRGLDKDASLGKCQHFMSFASFTGIWTQGLGLARWALTWATPPTIFTLVIFQVGSHITAQGWPQTWSYLHVHVAETTSTCKTMPSLFVEMGNLANFLSSLASGFGLWSFPSPPPKQKGL